MKHDYKKIDEKMRYLFRSDRLAAARRWGYRYISESIVKEYRKTKSARKTGARLGGLTADAIRAFLHKINEPDTGPGGYRPGDRRGKVANV